MKNRLASLTRSMPMRLALALVMLFSVVSLLSLAASYLITQRSLEQAMRDDLKQDMAGFRAAPGAVALAALVEAEARVTDPERLVLSYLAQNRRHYGNAMIARDEDGYHVVSVTQNTPRIEGRFLALTSTLHGGRLTIARSRAEIDALARVFLNILWLSLLPTTLIALSGGLYLARRTARNVAVVSGTLDRLTSGDLDARVGPTAGWSNDLARIGEKTDEMADAQQKFVAALRQVSSDIAHDLKTPIQRVAVHLDDLSAQPELGENSRGLVGQAKDEIDGIVSVFRSLLQIAQVEAGTPRSRFAAVDLGDVIQTCAELYEPVANETAHTLTTDIPAKIVPLVFGDRNLLTQSLANLIENALRHTPAGVTITIGLEKDGDHVALRISDNGPGIPKDEFENVLQRLYRLDRSRMTPGSGLGLSLVAVVAKLHGARLELSDNAPGLCVRITFPELPNAANGAPLGSRTAG